MISSADFSTAGAADFLDSFNGFPPIDRLYGEAISNGEIGYRAERMKKGDRLERSGVLRQ